MENQEKPEDNNPFTQPFQDRKKQAQSGEEEENIFDNNISDGMNSLGQNPEQILYDKPENVEDASQIVSDGNDE